jgi:hypothetical protein
VTRSLAPGIIDQARADLAGHPSARLGLVVYLEVLDGDRPPSPAGPGQGGRPVLAISLQQLLRGMASASFAEVIRDIGDRNAALALITGLRQQTRDRRSGRTDRKTP